MNKRIRRLLKEKGWEQPYKLDPYRIFPLENQERNMENLAKYMWKYKTKGDKRPVLQMDHLKYALQER